MTTPSTGPASHLPSGGAACGGELGASTNSVTSPAYDVTMSWTSHHWMPTPQGVPDHLLRGVRRAWSRRTSFQPDQWSADNPAFGQCAVTALAVQDLLGGDILRAETGGVSHFWNRLPDGTEIDLTEEQFQGIQASFGRVELASRTDLLSSPWTLERYQLLRTRMANSEMLVS